MGKFKMCVAFLALFALVGVLVACSQTTTVQGPAEGVAQVSSGERLQEIKDRGSLICAGRTDLAGFGYLDDSGANAGFDIDICKAVAAAVLVTTALVPFAQIYWFFTVETFSTYGILCMLWAVGVVILAAVVLIRKAS